MISIHEHAYASYCIFTAVKNDKFQMKYSDISLSSAQYISVDTLGRNKTKDVYSCKPDVYIVNVGVKITFAC